MVSSLDDLAWSASKSDAKWIDRKRTPVRANKDMEGCASKIAKADHSYNNEDGTQAEREIRYASARNKYERRIR